MPKLTLPAAYRAMIATAKGSIGVRKQRRYEIRKGIKAGRYPKIATMRKHLEAAGWRAVSEEMWTDKTT